MAQVNLSEEQIQDQILTKLEADFGNQYAVEDFPGDPANYQLKHSNGAILLILKDRKYDEPQTTRGTGQPNYPEIWISLLARNLRSEKRTDGIYQMMHAVKQSLRGFQIGVSYLWISRSSLGGFKPGGVIIYNMNWKFQDYWE